MTAATIEQTPLTAATEPEKMTPQDEAEQMAWEAAAAAMLALKSSFVLAAAPSTTPSVLSSDDGSEDLIKTEEMMDMSSHKRLDANGDEEEEEDEDEEDMPHLLPGQEQSLLYPSTLLKHAPELLELTDESTLTSLDAQDAFKDGSEKELREGGDDEMVTDLDSKLPPPPSALGAPTTDVSQTSSAAALMEAYTAASHAASYEESYEQQMQQRTFASPYAYPIVETTKPKELMSSPRAVPPTLTASGRISKQAVFPGGSAMTPSRSRSPRDPFVRRLYPCPTPDCSKVYKNANGLKYHLERGKCDALGDAKIAPEAIAPPVSSRRSSSVKLPERPYYCRITGCIKYYRNLSGLKYHSRTAHPELDFEMDVKGLLNGKEDEIEAVTTAPVSSSALIDDDLYYG